MKTSLVFLSILSLAAATLPNLVDLANANNATTLTQFLATAGLDDVIRDQGPFTIIAPVDSAFAKIPSEVAANLTANPNELANVLQYHVVKGEIFTFDLRSGQVLTSLNGHSIRVYMSGNQIFFNQARVVSMDVLQGSNGVIYLVDEVLSVPEGTIDQILMNPDYEISEFLELVKVARLEGALNRTAGTRYTVFAPTNAAINSLDPSILQKIKSSYSLTHRLVDYHIHRGTLHEKSLDHSGHISTMYTGHSITLTVGSDGVAKLNNVATLQETDIEAEDGVVHVISHVLIPSTLFSSIVG
ncbi:transforming growth factor-beta-induced protein ig-h3-like [Ylistrum balloti]|uniref:transforming growth factor-beta-induced protein ig-h3-like n=1 Tax=Ylistrum balloti TaxID=509963 RepID=UPI002905B679|nr:transforming growth factor-beta-induced protein ig-h3-like [Ylistrum balloti]